MHSANPSTQEVILTNDDDSKSATMVKLNGSQIPLTVQFMDLAALSQNQVVHALRHFQGLHVTSRHKLATVI